jgi:hypothetical protein
MAKNHLRKYLILVGPLQGKVVMGRQIGYLLSPDDVDVRDTMVGIWVEEFSQKVCYEQHANIVITRQGAWYGDSFIDLCVTYDRLGNEIDIGDTIYFSSKNEVVRGIVEKIDVKATYANYGIINRKMKVRPIDNDCSKIKTVTNSTHTILA